MFLNQKGFTYPLTLCFLLLFSTLFLVHLDQAILGKRMLIETETILKQEYYFSSSVKTIEKFISLNGILETSGSISFRDGQADYKIIQINESMWQIQIILTTQNHTAKSTQVQGVAYYDAKAEKMVKWIEKN